MAQRERLPRWTSPTRTNTTTLQPPSTQQQRQQQQRSKQPRRRRRRQPHPINRPTLPTRMLLPLLRNKSQRPFRPTNFLPWHDRTRRHTLLSQIPIRTRRRTPMSSPLRVPRPCRTVTTRCRTSHPSCAG